MKEATEAEKTEEKRYNVSIHASMKEATMINCRPVSSYDVSIHASMKEATATYCDTSAIMYISSLNNFFVHYF